MSGTLYLICCGCYRIFYILNLNEASLNFKSRYTRRFDPGFGFNGGSYAIQPTFTPALNYSTEFPQLRSAHRPQISAEHQSLDQHLSGLWAAPSRTAGVGYGHLETLPYSPNPVGTHSPSGVHLQSSQHSGQQPYGYSHERVHPIFSQVS